MTRGAWLAGAAAVLSFATPAMGTTVLNFEGVGNLAGVNDFYNGGTDSLGNSGINYGINFSTTSLGIIDSDAGGTGNIANETSPSTVLFFLDGGAATMNVASGFTTGFSFYYAGNSTDAGTVNVYDGLNGTGNILASLLLTPNGGACSGDPSGFPFCNFSAFGVSFAGTALSVDFGGVANQIVFDDVTLGSATPGAVPEPGTWAMMLLGFGFAGGALRYRRGKRTLNYAVA